MARLLQSVITTAARPAVVSGKAALTAAHLAKQAAKQPKPPAPVKLMRKEMRTAKHAIKRRLVQGEMAGLFDFVSQGFSVVKDLAPAALKASVQSKIAASQAKSVQRVTDAQNAALTAQERAAAASQAQQLQQQQAATAAATAAAWDWKKPAAIGGGVLLALLALPRLLPGRTA